MWSPPENRTISTTCWDSQRFNENFKQTMFLPPYALFNKQKARPSKISGNPTRSGYSKDS